MSVADLEYLRDVAKPFGERWAKFAAYWPHVRTTGYGRALIIAARDLHGVEDITDATAEALAEKVAASNRPGWYRRSSASAPGSPSASSTSSATSSRARRASAT